MQLRVMIIVVLRGISINKYERGQQKDTSRFTLSVFATRAISRASLLICTDFALALVGPQRLETAEEILQGLDLNFYSSKNVAWFG